MITNATQKSQKRREDAKEKASNLGQKVISLTSELDGIRQEGETQKQQALTQLEELRQQYVALSERDHELTKVSKTTSETVARYAMRLDEAIGKADQEFQQKQQLVNEKRRRLDFSFERPLGLDRLLLGIIILSGIAAIPLLIAYAHVV